LRALHKHKNCDQRVAVATFPSAGSEALKHSTPRAR
jgi:hypothetical protein